jgi:DNA-binding NtrC family response regulator
MEKMNILIVDDEPSLRETLSETLRGCGYAVETAQNGAEALQKFSSGGFSLVITDMRMPKTGGMDLLRGVKKISPATPVIVITAYGTVTAAVEAMKEGAADFIMKPFPPDHIEMSVSNILKRSAQEMQQHAPVVPTEVTQDYVIISQDRRMVAVQEMLKNVAKSKSSVLIQGESGTGKELFARFLYRHSDRKGKPFVAVNCAAIPEHLLESEMFGYEKGAFTGATQRKLGKFELANKGTLLLDEIGDMDLHLQAKLLRVIQEEEIDRVGGHDPIPVDVRLIATTNANLQRGIEEKKFRMDLYYRLNVVPVKIPPLRERGGDIDLLTDFFLTKYSLRNNRSKPKVSPEVMKMLRAASWPGNVRELENVIERAVLLCQGTEIVPENLCFDESFPPIPQEDDGGKREVSALSGMTLRDMEKNLIVETLQTVHGNKTRASELLGVSVRTVRNKLNEYQLENVS